MTMSPNNNRSAVFLDRDGTLNEDHGYIHRIEDLVWIDGAKEAVQKLNEAGLPVIVVTNQAGVARGYYSEDDVRRFHAHMQSELNRVGADIDAFYFCPYHPEGSVPEYRRQVPERKPGTGMFEAAMAAHHVDPKASYMVGDKNSDMEPGIALGMTTFLVETGYGAFEKTNTRADYVVENLGAAVDRILILCSTTP